MRSEREDRASIAPQPATDRHDRRDVWWRPVTSAGMSTWSTFQRC